MASFSLLHPLFPSISPATKTPRLVSPCSPPCLSPSPKTPSLSLIARARAKSDEAKSAKELKKVEVTEKEEEVEEDLPWIQEKALDLVEFTGTVTQAIPGPRVGRSPLPWILAVPLAYVGLSFFIAVVKTVKKLTSPKAKKKRLVSKNAFLLKSIDDLFQKGKDEMSNSALKGLMQKTGFSMDDILRKYIRYALNEKPFNPDLVVDLIHLRKASMLEDPQVAEVLNETSRRIVKEKGPVVMDISGFTEKGFKRKLAVQSLFGKIFYLSEVLCTLVSLMINRQAPNNLLHAVSTLSLVAYKYIIGLTLAATIITTQKIRKKKKKRVPTTLPPSQVLSFPTNTQALL